MKRVAHGEPTTNATLFEPVAYRIEPRITDVGFRFSKGRIFK